MCPNVDAIASSGASASGVPMPTWTSGDSCEAMAMPHPSAPVSTNESTEHGERAAVENNGDNNAKDYLSVLPLGGLPGGVHRRNKGGGKPRIHPIQGVNKGTITIRPSASMNRHCAYRADNTDGASSSSENLYASPQEDDPTATTTEEARKPTPRPRQHHRRVPSYPPSWRPVFWRDATKNDEEDIGRNSSASASSSASNSSTSNVNAVHSSFPSSVPKAIPKPPTLSLRRAQSLPPISSTSTRSRATSRSHDRTHNTSALGDSKRDESKRHAYRYGRSLSAPSCVGEGKVGGDPQTMTKDGKDGRLDIDDLSTLTSALECMTCGEREDCRCWNKSSSVCGIDAIHLGSLESHLQDGGTASKPKKRRGEVSTNDLRPSSSTRERVTDSLWVLADSNRLSGYHRKCTMIMEGLGLLDGGGVCGSGGDGRWCVDVPYVPAVASSYSESVESAASLSATLSTSSASPSHSDTVMLGIEESFDSEDSIGSLVSPLETSDLDEMMNTDVNPFEILDFNMDDEDSSPQQPPPKAPEIHQEIATSHPPFQPTKNNYETSSRRSRERHLDWMKQSQRSAGELLKQGQLDNAALMFEGMITRHRNELKRKRRKDDDVIGSLLFNIGNIHSIAHEYAKALDYYRDAFEVRERSLHEEHPDLVVTLAKIALMYYALDNIDAAESTYLDVLDRLRNRLTGRRDDLALGKVYNNLACCHFERGQYGSSFMWFRKALDVHGGLFLVEESESSSRDDDASAAAMNAATFLSNLCIVYAGTGEYEEATCSMEQAVELQRRYYDASHATLLSSLANLAYAASQGGDFETACAIYAECYEALKASLGADHSATVSSLGRYSECLVKLPKTVRTNLLFRKRARWARLGFPSKVSKRLSSK